MTTDPLQPQHSAPLFDRPVTMVALLYLLAFVVRLSNLGGVVTSFGVFPISTDSFYHLRRIQAAVADGLRVPDFDRYVNFPDGASVNWPFGFDWLYAAVTRGLYALSGGAGLPDEGWTVAVACFLTPLIGAATPCLTYLVAARLANAWAGLAAGFIVAWMPAVWVVGAVGYVDHHVFESLCVAMYLWAVVRERLRPWHGLAAGLAMVAGLLCATTLPLLIGLHALVTVGWIIAHWRQAEDGDARLRASLWAWHGLLVPLAPFVATRFAEPSGVNPALVTAWAAAFLAAGATLGVYAWRVRARRQALGWAVAWLLLGVGVLPRLALRDAWRFIQYGIAHIGAADPWLATIFESQPLLSQSFRDITNNYTAFLWLLPLAWALVLARAWRREKPVWTLLSLSAPTAGLALLQLKFSGLFAPPFAVVMGLALQDLAARLAGATGWRDRLQRPLPIGIAAAALAPAIIFTLGAPVYIVSPTGAFVDVDPALRWLATHTPATSPRGDQPRDYAILCDWTPGHWVIGIAGRPVIASPLGHAEPLREGIRDAAAMFALSPAESLRLLEARRARYILVTPMSPRAVMRDAAWDPKARSFGSWEDWNEQMKRSLYARLVADEAVPQGDAALTRMRLVYESDFETDYPLFTQPHAAAKVFERVAGAIIAGQTTPGARVQLSTRIRTFFRREFDYVDEVTADAQGRFERRVPYAQQRSPVTTLAAVTPYRVVTPEGAFTATATEADVIDGKTLQLIRAPGE
ncbi:MAG: hypothetical protein CFK52_02770 [Chloracidobacterium sp. CP2_5A]|nr:MAG: hypothetical protein CFK52_02770 [Chloracidobacterium sp. CP2_5A]